MRIDVIDTKSGFASIRANWDRVYMADEHSQHFLSWTWLNRFLERRKRWFILALRENDATDYVAFFPLRLVTQQDKKTGHFFDEIIMAGNFAADYTGFISEPVYEKHAIAGFAFYLKQQNWTNLKLDYFSGTIERREAMIRALQGPEVMFRDSTPKSPNDINNCICPVVPLPASFDEYLDTRMSSQTRQKLRRFLRTTESDNTYRITFATRETIGRDMHILLDLWRVRWAPVKGKVRTETLIGSSREMLMDSFDDGNLDVPILWHGDQPLGALANIIDRQKMAILFYITGRDENWKTPSPGLILHGYCIRRAIDMGFRYYDFLRGNEPYKYMFGPEERRISCTLFRTRSGNNLGDRLNPRSIRFVYQQALRLYRTGSKPQAEVAFRQVLQAAPNHDGAKFGLASLMFDKGRLDEAEVAFAALALKAEDPTSALLRLGETQLAKRHFGRAADTFAKVLDQAPYHHEALYKRGVALMADGQKTKAVQLFKTLKSYHSDDPGHLQYAKKASLALERIAMTPAPLSAGAIPARFITLDEEARPKRWVPPKVLH